MPIFATFVRWQYKTIHRIFTGLSKLLKILMFTLAFAVLANFATFLLKNERKSNLLSSKERLLQIVEEQQ